MKKDGLKKNVQNQDDMLAGIKYMSDTYKKVSDKVDRVLQELGLKREDNKEYSLMLNGGEDELRLQVNLLGDSVVRTYRGFEWMSEKDQDFFCNFVSAFFVQLLEIKVKEEFGTDIWNKFI